MFIMAGQNNEYNNSNTVKSECSMENMETYSTEVETTKKKRIKITSEFPYTVDPKDAEQFEHMLKNIYLNKFQKGYLQSGLSAVPFPPQKGVCDMERRDRL